MSFAFDLPPGLPLRPGFHGLSFQRVRPLFPHCSGWVIEANLSSTRNPPFSPVSRIQQKSCRRPCRSFPITVSRDRGHCAARVSGVIKRTIRLATQPYSLSSTGSGRQL